MRTRTDVLGIGIDAVSWQQAIDRICHWAQRRESRYVCACNVHVVVSARTDRRLEAAINDADLATPDGMPIAWSVRRAGFPDQARINGPDLMLRLCRRAAQEKIAIFLFGSSESTLALLKNRLLMLFPNLAIAGVYSPPFRDFTADENISIENMINQSGAGMVFVGLGCPKQEFWMQQLRGRIHAVMLGVGAAFDYHAGTLKRAPPWMQNLGLEWLYRLAAEPHRLWRRYLLTNTLFVAATTARALRHWK